jgi:uncharacterized protein YidB (DUF937 family)
LVESGVTDKEITMGLLDQIAGAFGGEKGGASGQNQIMLVAMELLQNQPGGLQGIIEQFTHAGLGEQAASWVSTGQNLPISAEDLKRVFGGSGGGQLRELAAKLGMDHDTAVGGLADALPGLVDKLTPNGKIEHDVVAQGFDLLKNLKIG